MNYEEKIPALTERIDGYLRLELGQSVPFAMVVRLPNNQLGILTNRESTAEIIATFLGAAKLCQNAREDQWLLSDVN